MQRNFPFSADFTASREGLYQSSPADDGNWTAGRRGVGRLVGTMRGISAVTMVHWVGDENLVTADKMKSIDAETFRAIANSLYWRALNADSLPSGVDLMVFDFGFNAGISRAARQLQQIVGLTDRALDGDVGKRTIVAVARSPLDAVCPYIARPYLERLQALIGVAPDGVAGPETLAALRQEADGHYLALLFALASRQNLAYRSFSNFQRFGSGWIKRLEARLDAAIALAQGRVPAV